MTIKDLMRIIPEEHWDKIIVINIPQLRAGDEGDFPLIEVNIEDYKGHIRIYMEADCG